MLQEEALMNVIKASLASQLQNENNEKEQEQEEQEEDDIWKPKHQEYVDWNIILLITYLNSKHQEYGWNIILLIKYTNSYQEHDWNIIYLKIKFL